MSATYPVTARARDHAVHLDSEDELKHLRDEFIIPTRGDLKSHTLHSTCKMFSY